MAAMVDDHFVALQPGTVIGGRYEVVKCLGSGSMGLVYACRHRELTGHMVACKVLFPEVARDKIAAQRFRNEIFASYGVSHPNVVRAYEYIKDGELVAYTMEYVGGGDLALKLNDPEHLLPISEITSILSQMCAGVQAIHDAGIVHRDLKPENILITKEGSVKIADFGIARYGHGPKLTEHGGVVGTIDYVSPEYMLNSQVDWRSDIYAMGILGYEMVTGQSPFRGDSVYETMTKRLKTDPKMPRDLRPECSAELETIILKAMQRDPEQRYQSAAEMFHDLMALNANKSSVSGTFLVAKQPSVDPYVGPSVQAKPEATSEFVYEGGPPRSRAVARPNIAGATSDVDTFDFSYNADPYVPRPSEVVANHPGAEFERASNGAAGIDTSATIYEPMRMDSVLSNPDIIRSASSSVSVAQGGINQDRMRNLAMTVERTQQIPWTDVILWAAVIFIGIAVGVLIIQYINPEPFRNQPQQQIIRSVS